MSSTSILIFDVYTGKTFGAFYRESSPFCNFYNSVISYKGQTYACLELAYQTQKFNGSDKITFNNLYKTHLAKMSSGEAAWKAASELKSLWIVSWLSYSNGIMKDLLKIKFAPNTRERTILNSTKGLYLVEHAKEKHWGDGLDGTGSNNLGKYLMEIRGDIIKPTLEYVFWLSTKSQPASAPRCKECPKACFYDIKTKSYSNYCSITCRDSGVIVKPKCKKCSKSCFYDLGRQQYSDYCSKTCRDGVLIPKCQKCSKSCFYDLAKQQYYDYCSKTCRDGGLTPKCTVCLKPCWFNTKTQKYSSFCSRTCRGY
jgi:N-glycosidase YbiA